MIKIDRNYAENAEQWKKAGIKIPGFDIQAMREKTAQKPEWVHFGAGNIFRGFMAACHQKLLEAGLAETGIVAVETFDYEIIDRVYKAHDNLLLNVSIQPDGQLDKELVASIVQGIAGDPSRKGEWDRLVGIFENPALKMVSFTITEKGYAISDSAGEYFDVIMSDIKNGTEAPVHVISKTAALMHKRYKAGKHPLSLVSMDNCSRNGEKLRDAVLAITEAWFKEGYVDKGFLEYVGNEKVVSFPWTMIDKITPRPSERIKRELEALGVTDTDIVITGKNTYISSFVNAEDTQYLFIEDSFPNGRLPLEKSKGVWFTDRDTVNRIETMKVTTCLNPLHTAIAIFGCLLNYTFVVDAFKDGDISALVRKIGYDEGLPVVIDPGIISPRDFLDEVVNRRFVNPFIPDETRRIATDTSMKVGIRFGETIKSYMKSDDLDIRKLVGIPLVIAAWCRYLLAVDDGGNAMELSPDPMKEELQRLLGEIRLGDSGTKLTNILSIRKIFGSDLYKAGLGDKIEAMFNEMLAGKGAVRETLKRYLC